MKAKWLRQSLVLASLLTLGACGAAPGPGGKEDGGEGGNGPEMRPGENCASCHNFSVSGTIFPKATSSAGSGLSGASIVITGADGKTVTLSSNGAGNFYTSSSIKFPAKAELVKGANKMAMTQQLTNGECASCHSSSPSGGAPGRLYVGP